MRHQKKGKTLGRKAAPRKALMRGLATSLVLYEKITTTKAKAQLLRPIIEKLITTSKVDSVHHRRQVAKVLYVKGAVRKMFEVIGPRFKDVKGGYTRIVKLPARIGDNAEVAAIEFIGGKIAAPKVEDTKKSSGKQIVKKTTNKDEKPASVKAKVAKK
jgi:large subunit ribosomal protein L17